MYLRRLPSGKWQCTVRRPDGRKETETHKLKTVVRQWGLDMEAAYGRGEVRDPRAGDVKVRVWRQQVVDAGGVGTATAAKNASIWRTHCEPRWGDWPMNAITRVQAQGWVDQLRETPRARHRGRAVVDDEDVPTLSAETVCSIVHVMTKLYRLAMKENPPIVTASPFAELDLPAITPEPVDFYEQAELDALYTAAEEVGGAQGRALVELGCHVGLRIGELLGLHAHRVDWLRGKLTVIDVSTRAGLREWPKSKRSRRTVPVPPEVLERMSTLMVDRQVTRLLFVNSRGGPIDDGDFRNRLWYPAVELAGIRRLSPRAMRHTAASHLVMDGVDLYRVQALLGHESFATTQRYSHLSPRADEDIVASWTRRSAKRCNG